MKVLQAAAEIFPLVKTGGLADVLGALPQALIAEGADVRLLLPGLPLIIGAVRQQTVVAELGALFGAGRVTLRLGSMPQSGVPTYVIDAPYLFERDGGPYQAPDGLEWPDNIQRFALLGWVAAHIAAGELDRNWTPDVLHAHDWHAAMACAYAAANPTLRALTVYTVHNLAYQGLFPAADFGLLGLPSRVMAAQGIEYHGHLSFMKAGLMYGRRVTTVSPNYAREIATADFGCGLDGVVRGRGVDVSGILNGVDDAVWNPATDRHIAERYTAADRSGKLACRLALQQELDLELRDGEPPVFGVVSRLTAQKGLDLVLAALPWLLQAGCQLVVQGNGERELEDAFRAAALEHPRQVAVRLAYDEALAHRVIAGSDALLVPSRFEPCGLTQLYALRYGTLPVVRRVGGLADTVVDANDEAIATGRATGISFDAPTRHALEAALSRAVGLHERRDQWEQVVRRGMAQQFSWRTAARDYLALYTAPPGLRRG